MPKGRDETKAARWAVYLELLIEARLSAKLTQAELASLADVTQPYVSQVEAGKIRLDAIQLADWLHACGSNLGRFGRALERRL
ncbi:transcriptional regulator with XRE-family HTH domain [Luteibacter sp. 621]|uniref:helix-turn-helix domain-containing protein n=1 Tax=Luteibacter sp. 621 TaxID=3373916 RepID=UPI003D20DE69